MKNRTRFIFLITALLLCGLATASPAADYYVDASTTEGNVVGDGTSEATAWQTITWALTQVSAGDIINVASGEYKSSMTGSSESFPLSVPNGVKIMGPVSGIATVEVVNGDAQNTFDLVSNCTLEGLKIINDDASEYPIDITGNYNLITGCTIESGGARGTRIDGAYNVVFNCTITTTGLNHGVELMDDADYCTIESSTINAGWNQIYCWNTAVNTEVRNNTVSGNYGLYFGGNNHNTSIEGNTVTITNAGSDGIEFYQSVGAGTNTTIFDNTIVGASSTNTSGDGLRLNITGTVSSNEVRRWGYGINVNTWMSQTGTLNIDRNTVVMCKNAVTRSWANGTVNLTNNILSGTPALGGSYLDDSTAAYNYPANTFVSRYNCYFNNETNYDGNNGTVSDRTGDIFVCPRFYNATGNDYRLFSDSPCLTGGEGGTRMGRYGSVGTASSLTDESWATPGGTGDGSQGSPWSLTAAATLTTHVIHVGPGAYNPGAGESFPVELGNNRRLSGTGEAIIDEDSDSSKNTLSLGSYSTVEGVKVDNDNGSAYASIMPYGEWNLITNCTIAASSQSRPIYDKSSDGGDYNVISNNRIIIGGGLIAYPVTIYGDHCTIEANTFSGRFIGNGAIDLLGANATVKNNDITNTNGNGINLAGNNASIEGNSITIQSAGTDGIYGGADNYTVFNNTVVGGSPTNTGGDGIDLAGYGTMVSNEVRDFGYGITAAWPTGNVIIDRNTVVKCKTGIRREWTSDGVYVRNCIVSSSPEGGSGIAGSVGILRQDGYMHVSYTDIYGVETLYSGTITKASTIHANAQFMDPAGNDYHLKYNSPCIDSGNPASTPDPDGSIADMGCYYFDLTVPGTVAVYVKQPNGGESLTGKTTYEITWYATREDYGTFPITSIEIDYSTNEGTDGYPYSIAAESVNDGTYDWFVPQEGTTEAKVRIGVFGSAATDESDSGFSMTLGGVYYVDAVNGSDEAGDGSSGNPWQTITYALGSSEAGDTIRVLAGTYDTSLGETFPLNLGDNRVLEGYGSGIATIEVTSGDVDTISMGSNSTVEGLTIKNSDNAENAVNMSGNYSLVTNCTIEASNGAKGVYVAVPYNKVSGNTIISGGSAAQYGIYVYYSAHYCTMESNTISGEFSSANIYIQMYLGSVPNYQYIRNSTLTNTAANGHGISARGNNPASVEGNSVTVTGQGDGILFDNGTANAYIFDNTVVGGGGSGSQGIYFVGYGSAVSNEVRGFETGLHLIPRNTGITVDRNTIVKCKTGVYEADSGGVTASLQNNIISVRPALGTYYNDSVGINKVTGAGIVSLESNCVFNHENDYVGAVTIGSGNINSCPRFLDVDNDDYRLCGDSPCKNAGIGGVNMGRYGSVAQSSGITAESWVSPPGGSPAGDDSRLTSTPALPWAMVGRALSSTESTVNVMEGTYNESALVVHNYCKLTNYNNELASIEAGSDAHTIYTGSNTTIEGLTIKNSYSGKYGIDIYGDSNLIEGCSFEASGGASGVYLDGSNNLVSGCSFEVSGGTQGLYVNGNYSEIRGSNIFAATSSAQYGVYISGTGAHCTIESNSISGEFSNSNIYAWIGVAYQYIRNNILTNTSTSGNGISARGNNPVLVEGNSIIVDGSGDAIIFDNGTANMYIFNNEVRGGGGSNSIGIFARGYGTVVSNEVRGFETGVLVSPLSSSIPITVECDTIVKCKYGIDNDYDPNTAYIRNCIISSAPDNGSPISGSIGVYDSHAGSGTTNVSYCDVYGNETSYSGVDIVIGAGTISATAQFADVGNDDYHLRYNSPCIDSGTPEGTDMGRYPYTFTAGATPGVYVKTPNGGESWGASYSEDITWYATQDVDVVDSIDLYYSIDGGASYSQIALGEANDGVYEWTVENQPTTEAKIRVVAHASIGTDESDSNFTIFSTDSVPPTIEVTAPITGEALRGGSLYNITWTITDESGIKPNSLNIYYSIDGGSTFPSAIVTGTTESDNIYPWTVASENTAEARIRVNAQDALDNWGTGESYGSFTIDSTPPSVPTLISPSNGSKIASSTPTYSWNASTDNLTGVASYEIKVDSAVTTQGATTSYPQPTPLAEGFHTWEVKAKDGVGNWSAYSTAFTFEVDTSGPNLTGIILRDLDTLVQSFTNALTISVEAQNVTGSPTQMMMSENADFSGAAWVSYQNPATFEISAGQGLKTVRYKLRDALLNPSVTVEANITLDTQPPYASIFKPSPWQVLAGGISAEVKWEAIDSVSGVAADGIDIYYSVNAGADGYPNIITTEVSNTGSHYWMVPYLNGEAFKLKLVARDNAGNSTTAYSDERFIITTVLSSIVITDPAAGASVRGGLTREVTCVTSTEVGWQAFYTFAYSLNGGVNWAQVVVPDSLTGTHTWSVPAATTSECYVSFEATDKAGRQVSAISGKFSIDSTTPAVSGITPADGSTNVTTEGLAIVIQFSEEMDRLSAQAAFAVAPELTGSFSWSGNGSALTFTPDTVLRGGSLYQVTVEAGAKDLAGNPLAAAFSAGFTTSAPVENIPPEVFIRIKGTALKSGDYIPARPTIEAVATDNFQITVSGVTMYVDGTQVEATDVRSYSAASVEVIYTVPRAYQLAVGAHSIRVEAIDAAGNAATREVTDLKVTAVTESVQLDYAIAHPTTFKPGAGETSTFSYILNKDANITIYVYGPGGEVSWTRHYAAGSMGGQAGYNMVAFDGISDISGAPLGNGIYVFKIIADKQAKGNGYIVVYE